MGLDGPIIPFMGNIALDLTPGLYPPIAPRIVFSRDLFAACPPDDGWPVDAKPNSGRGAIIPSTGNRGPPV